MQQIFLTLWGSPFYILNERFAVFLGFREVVYITDMEEPDKIKLRQHHVKVFEILVELLRQRGGFNFICISQLQGQITLLQLLHPQITQLDHPKPVP
jgi:hypothetical protein